MNRLCLSPLPFLVTLLWVVFIGSPVFCVAANLRASSVSFPSEDTITVSDSDLVGTRSFLAIELEGYEMKNLSQMSPKERAILDCAFREAFDEVHGDRDGLYLSGQQIVASDEATSAEDDDEDDEDDHNETGMIDAPTQAPRPVVELRHRPYVRRPRVFKKKARERPAYPPPKPPPRQKQNEPKVEWNIYWYADMSGRCNMCPDDDSMESDSLLLSSNEEENPIENLARGNKKVRDQAIASDFVLSEASVNAIADAMRTKLIEGTCAPEGDTDHFFEYIEDTDIFVLSQEEFESSVAAISASREVANVSHSASVAATGHSQSSNTAGSLLPFYYGESFSTKTSIRSIKSRLEMIKIGLSGVSCGPWDNEALLDMNSGLHDSINSLGFTDKGHIVDKIVKRRKTPLYQRRYIWKCHYDIYAKVDLDFKGAELDESSLGNIGDALCDDMVRYSGSQKFQNTIDCQLQRVSAAEYESVVTSNDEAGVALSLI